MKKTSITIIAFLISIVVVQAQTIVDAIKMLNYNKNKSAKDMLQKMYESNNKDQTTIYWYGQSMIVKDDVDAAKKLYQDALTNGVNEPLIWVGMAHINLLENNDWNAALQKFEQAITFTTETRGRNKGKPSVAVLNAIGRANAIGHSIKDGSSKFGNMEYAIEKLRLASSIDITNSECFIYMGLCFRKMGGEFGGDAQKSYLEAISRDATNPLPHYLIGKIYQSQDNKQFMDQYFNAALAVDISYPPVYLDYYYYYSDRDVPQAKTYIEKYIQLADKDCHNDYFYADYLFRAGNYQESLAKAILLDNSECKARVPVLYAYNYDRLNDSIKAKKYIEEYLSTAHLDKILITDYDLAIKIESRFPGQEQKAIEYINKAIEMDSSKNGKLRYLTHASKIYANAGNYNEQLIVLQKIVNVRGSKSEYDHYILTSTAYKSDNYVLTMELAKDYMANFPNKSQGFDFNVRAARKIDTINSTGLYFDAITKQIEFYKTDTVNYKQQLVNNYYVQMAYFNDTKKDFLKAIEVCDKILSLIPNEPQTIKIREALLKNAELKGLKPAVDLTGKSQ